MKRLPCLCSKGVLALRCQDPRLVGRVKRSSRESCAQFTGRSLPAGEGWWGAVRLRGDAHAAQLAGCLESLLRFGTPCGLRYFDSGVGALGLWTEAASVSGSASWDYTLSGFESALCWLSTGVGSGHCLRHLSLDCSTNPGPNRVQLPGTPPITHSSSGLSRDSIPVMAQEWLLVALRSLASHSFHPALRHLPVSRVELGSTVSPAPGPPRLSCHPSSSS